MEIVVQVVKKFLIMPWSFLIPCFTFLSILSFFPCIRNILGVETLYLPVRPWLSLLWLYCFAFLLYRLTRLASNCARKKLWARNTKLLLEELPPAEEHILRHILESESRGAWVPLEDAAVNTLLHRRLILKTSNLLSSQPWEDSEYGSVYCLLAEINPVFETAVRRRLEHKSARSDSKSR